MRFRMPVKRPWVALALPSILIAAAQAQVSFLPPDEPAATVVGDGKTATSTSMNVILQSTSDAALVFQSHGLHGAGMDLGPASLTATPPALQLKAKDYVTVPIAVSGLTKFGWYRGTIEFREAKIKPGGGTIIPLSILVRGAIIIPNPALSAFHCLIPLSCIAGERIAPTMRSVLINNQDGQQPAQPNSPTIMLHNAAGNLTLYERDLHPAEVPPIAAGASGQMDLTVPADKAVAGHYDGYFRLGFASGETITSPITLDVRDGPLIAILVLLLGIIFGRLLQAVNTPTAQAQQRMLTNLASLRSAAASIDSPDVALLLEKKMADARQAIATMIAGEQAITQQLQDIGTAITIESNLEWIDANLNRISEANRPAVEADVNNSRTFLLDDKPTEADAARKEAQGKLLGQLSAVLPGKMTAQNMQFNATLPEPPKRQLHERLASFAAGTPPHLPTGKHGFVKDLMFVALLVGLVILGLFTLYTKNVIFGSNGLFDYFSIAVWGLSADVAQRTLQGLQLPK